MKHLWVIILNACSLEKQISEQTYNNILLLETTARTSRTSEKQIISVNKLYHRGFRKIEFTKRIVKGLPTSRYFITIFINFEKLIHDDDIHSFNPDDYDASTLISIVEHLLSNFVNGYTADDIGIWRFVKIEYSKDLYINDRVMFNIIRKSDYISGRRKLQFVSYKSGIEFEANKATGQRTNALHVYHKLTERESKGYILSPEDKTACDFFRVELILYRDCISDRSRTYGFPLGNIEDFMDSFIEAHELKSIITQIYGTGSYFKRKNVIQIINTNIKSISMQRKLISFLDKINRTSINTIRQEYVTKGKTNTFKKYMDIIGNLGFSPIYLPYDYPITKMPSLAEQLCL